MTLPRRSWRGLCLSLRDSSASFATKTSFDWIGRYRILLAVSVFRFVLKIRRRRWRFSVSRFLSRFCLKVIWSLISLAVHAAGRLPSPLKGTVDPLRFSLRLRWACRCRLVENRGDAVRAGVDGMRMGMTSPESYERRTGDVGRKVRAGVARRNSTGSFDSPRSLRMTASSCVRCATVAMAAALVAGAGRVEAVGRWRCRRAAAWSGPTGRRAGDSAHPENRGRRPERR